MLTRGIRMTQCILLLLLGALFFTNCSEDDSVPELRFSIAVNEVADFSASITVTHTGTNRVAYYVFAVEGQVCDLGAEIQKHKKAVSNESHVADVYDQKKRVIRLSGLLPEKLYTCIVYGVDDTGNIIGTFASTSFTTKTSSIEFELNPKWELSYKGQSKYNNKTYSRIDVNVIGEIEERYFFQVYDVSVIKNFSDIREVLFKAYYDFNSERNELEEEFFWVEDKFVRTGSTIYYKYLTKGKYQAFAIGVDASGALTGHYACSEEFEFEKYELEPEYSSLLGKWKVTDNTGNAIIFTLSEKWANSTFTISGWGYNDCPLTMNYKPLGTYFLSIPGQSAKGSAWGEKETTTMTLRPWYLNEKNKFIIYTSSIVETLARSKGKNSDGTLTFSQAFNINLENGEYAKTNGIILTSYDKAHGLIPSNNSKIQLPFTMKKIK